MPGPAPQVVLLDADMRGSDALAPLDVQPIVAAMPAWLSLSRRLMGSRFVLLATRPDGPLRRQAGQAGIHWVLDKRSAPAELVKAIKSAHMGTLPAPAGASVGPPTHSVAHAGEGDSLGQDLTPRQIDLLQAMTRGLSNQQIAEELSIALPTVKFHVAGIMIKLKADNRTAAVITALKLGIVQLD